MLNGDNSMSPKQCLQNPTENSAQLMGSCPLELIQLTNQMYEHADWVIELESLATIASISARSVAHVRRLWQNLLDSLLVLAHVAHRFLRNGDPDVRAAAELLTSGTAQLIGRLYDMMWASPPTAV